MPAAPADRVVTNLIHKTHQINNTPSSQALMKSDSQQLMEDYKKVSVISGSRASLKSDKSVKITGAQWWAIAILTFVNLINYMDRYTIAGRINSINYLLHTSFNMQVLGKVLEILFWCNDFLLALYNLIILVTVLTP